MRSHTALTSPPPPPTLSRVATRYIVLRQIAELVDRAFERVEEVEATGAKQALAKVAEKMGEAADGTVLVAVPKRSWYEQPIALEQRSRVVIGGPPRSPKLTSASAPPAEAASG